MIVEETTKERDKYKKREKKLAAKNLELKAEVEAGRKVIDFARKEQERVEIGVLKCLYDDSQAINMLKQVARDVRSAPYVKGDGHEYTKCEYCEKLMRMSDYPNHWRAKHDPNKP